MKEFGQFAASVGLGVIDAVRSDPDVFMLAVAGVIGGRKTMSNAVLVYVAARRVDKIAGHFAQIMSENPNSVHP